MTTYINLNKTSGVRAYELGSDRITVVFNDGWAYLYTAQSAGGIHVRRMAELAENGQGLNAYINTYVKKAYSRKYQV